MGEWFNKNGGTLLGSLLGGLFNIGSNAMQIKYQREANAQNVALQRETNALNAQMVREQNAAAMSESEKARSYDSATAQVGRLRAAGMSKAGALGAINGAGGYTPAPVNAAQAHAPQVQAPQVDFTGVSNAIQGFLQLSEQKRQFNETMKLERDKFAEEQLNNAKVRDLQDAQISKIAKDNDVSDATILKLFADTELTYAELRTELSKYDLNVKQAALISEQTKLTAAQILQVKENTKLVHEQIELVKQQALKTFEERGLTAAQTAVAWKQFEDLDNKVNQYLDDVANGKYVNEREIIRLNKEILEFTKSIKADEALTSQTESEIENNPAGYGLRMWEYVISKMFPVGKTIFGKSK